MPISLSLASSIQENTSPKTDKVALGALQEDDVPPKDTEVGEAHEIFHVEEGSVGFRSVSWQRATVVFIKINFAMSILTIPAALAALGSVGGCVLIVGFTALNTYTGVILGEFRNKHPECHMLADMMGLLWGRTGREIVGVQIVIAQILVSASGIVTTGTAFNALSNHGTCTVVFALVSAILITMCSSIRTFSRLGWLTWFGFVTFFLAVFVFTVAVTQQDRPAAAPATGDFDLGWAPFAKPNFVIGMLNTANVFVSTSGSSMFLPVISEMRRPQDYRKACLLAGFIVGAIYLTFSVVIYRYCGAWLSSPAFGSAGPLFKKISYGIALPGLVVGVGIYQHVAAKYVFVRLLRDSRHMQANTLTHWSTWLGSNLLLGAAAFVVAEAVPILNYLLGLASAVCFAPFSLVFPLLLWMYDQRGCGVGSAGQRVKYTLHAVIVAVGLLMIVGGTYSVAISIRDAFANRVIARVFDCRDNSGSSL
ncbi:putative amino acid transporter [Aspergillus aculeatinus CBS 121060]|uniref:Amino acid transporter n=1 Tax=Aspergillus aculeatinus CBS 121060 TaxID=1448322 RepID=A0ACD1H114_9EURO|nr:putative amino acid transporter [Aspergillus aculeatinus CBS 121060]RAH67116.1 putative amino acid transporter [Aspergillus aculeatinus CBS 121060]